MDDIFDKTARVERVTSSFSLEGRSPSGTKTSSFLSMTVACDGDGWTLEEARYVQAKLSLQVAQDLYTDAYLRSQITKEDKDALNLRLADRYTALLSIRGAKLQHVIDAGKEVEGEHE